MQLVSTWSLNRSGCNDFLRGKGGGFLVKKFNCKMLSALRWSVIMQRTWHKMFFLGLFIACTYVAHKCSLCCIALFGIACCNTKPEYFGVSVWQQSTAPPNKCLHKHELSNEGVTQEIWSGMHIYCECETKNVGWTQKGHARDVSERSHGPSDLFAVTAEPQFLFDVCFYDFATRPV